MCVRARACVCTDYPGKCGVCIGNGLGRHIPMCSVWCRPGVHFGESIHMTSPVVWIRQLSGASLDLFHSESEPLSLL